MIKKHDDTYKSWKPYIMQCIECNTFKFADSIPKSDRVEASRQLDSCIYSGPPIKPYYSGKKRLDTILSDYKSAFEKLPNCQDAKLILSRGNDNLLSWSVLQESSKRKEQISSSERKVDLSKQYVCVLKIGTTHRAEAIPFDEGKKIVTILDANDRKGAFDGDIVKVGVVAEDETKCYGQVIRPLRSSNDIKFVCYVSRDNPIFFYPVDNKNPKLLISLHCLMTCYEEKIKT